MRGSSLGYLIKEGAKSVYINRLMSFASIGVLVACLLLIGSSLLFSMNVNAAIGYIEAQNEAALFVEDSLTDEEIKVIDLSINMLDNISEVVYVSKDQALEEQKQALGDSALLLEGLEGEENPYPNMFRIRFDKLDRLKETVDALYAIPGVSEVKVSTDVAEIITSVKMAVYSGGAAIVVILLCVSLVIIANTMKVTVFNRRKEISIMKMVGATNSFIRLPFIVEGIILGLVSAFVAYGLLWWGYQSLTIQVMNNSSTWIKQFSENMVLFETVSKELLVFFFCGGVGVGTIGSMVFIGKYLKI